MAKNTSMKRVPISNRIFTMTITLVVVAVLIAGVVAFGGYYFVNRSVKDSNEKLSEKIMNYSSLSLTEQLELNKKNIASDKAEFAEAKFETYTDYLVNASTAIHDLYVHRDSLPKKEVLKPNKKNDGKLVLQRTLNDESVTREDVLDDLEMFGNIEIVLKGIMAGEKDRIATIYFGTEDGLLISYDKYSGDASSGKGETYYKFKERDWYKDTKKEQKMLFSEPYDDSYNRGLTVTASVPLYDEKDKFVGVLGIDVLVADINSSIIYMGEDDSSYAMLVNEKGQVIAAPGISSSEEEIVDITERDKETDKIIDELVSDTVGISKTKSGNYYSHAPIKNVGWNLVVYTPGTTVTDKVELVEGIITDSSNATSESLNNLIRRVVILFIVFLVLIIVISFFVSRAFSKKLTKPIKSLHEDVKKISEGDFNVKAKVLGNDEIGDLAWNFNYMTRAINEYMENLKKVTAEKERIGAELNVATQIQADMLPSIFPPFPEIKEFDIYATMNPAKEVGGDFYDFFLVDDNHIALVMADVSGKGVPAALFMVIAKTHIKNRTMMGGTPSEILAYVNDQLCEGNEAELFVTVWLGIIEISTGKGIAANAGHEHPVIRRAGGDYELVVYRHSPAVATMEGIRFREHEFEIHPGDSLYVYTDGVPEATNAENVLYGTDRMLDVLNNSKDVDLEERLKLVKKDIDKFVGDAPQFDDITMLGFDYYGPNAKKED
ncbi:MAG: SpoIIE family protein phosphatase [Lachnospiraceae bacterium]|nr:SpoIIE family protein phosphatase [Lachnospiraceae bacterium]